MISKVMDEKGTLRDQLAEAQKELAAVTQEQDSLKDRLKTLTRKHRLDNPITMREATEKVFWERATCESMNEAEAILALLESGELRK